MRLKRLGNIFENIGNSVIDAFNSMGDAVNLQTYNAFHDPKTAFTDYLKFHYDSGIALPVNASASLFTASTGQKGELLTYSTSQGRAFASPSDLSSGIASYVGGGIVTEIFPWMNILHTGIFEIQKSLFPNSVNLIATGVSKNNTPYKNILPNNQNKNKAGLEFIPIILILGTGMLLTHLENGKHKKKSKTKRSF